MLLAHADRSDQGTDTDLCGTKVVDFIDFQAGIYLTGMG